MPLSERAATPAARRITSAGHSSRSLPSPTASTLDTGSDGAITRVTWSVPSRKTGGSVRLGFPLTENLWLNTSYTLSFDSIYEVDTTTASRAVREAQGDAITSSIGQSITYDTRNHPRNPNRGLYFQVAGDFAGAGGDVQYIRVQSEGRAYYPITDNITFVGRVIGGHIEGWGGDEVRLLDLFYKGGETIRGFGRSGIGPRDLNTGDSLGGATFWSATAEVRFPLPLIPEELGVSGAFFADAGSLFEAGAGAKGAQGTCAFGNLTAVCLADDASIRTSAGASIIWNSPVGPLRFDYAFPITKESYDRVQQFRFGASTKF